MGTLKTNWKKKLNKALVRVEKVVIMEIRKSIDQQRKLRNQIQNKEQTNKPKLLNNETKK